MPSDPNTRRPANPFVKVVGMVLLFVLIASAVLAVGPALMTSAMPPPAQTSTVDPVSTPAAGPGTPQFTSCEDVWAGGAGPFRAGEPGYNTALDPDGDGIACESKPK